MTGVSLYAIVDAIPGAGALLSDGHLIVVLATQATCCIAAGLAASYLWQRRAARAHRILLAGLLASIVMPLTYLLVRHLGLGILTPSVPVSYEPQNNDSFAESALMMSVNVSTLSASDAETGLSQIEDEELFDEAFAFDPTEPRFMDETLADPAHSDTSLPWPLLFFSGSLATGLALCGRLLWQFRLGRRLLVDAQAVDAGTLGDALAQARQRMGVDRPVHLRCSPYVRSPLIWCWGREPVLLVHRQTSRRPPHGDWVGIFCHELAHWKRLDHVTGLFCELLWCAVPWHPLLWWARGRLSALSEEACDDWVLAGGRVGVDYAESLLGLSPQAQLAFLPTVVGKEKAMKERICRILNDRCGNPHAGARWAVLVAVAALGTSVTVALAQPGPRISGGPEGPANPAEVSRPKPPRQAADQQRPLLIEGRRNVLNRLLDNLREQRQRTEAKVQERGDRQDNETVVLRSELAAIRNHIAVIERQLESLDQAQPGKAAGPGPARGVGRPAVDEPRLSRLQNRISEAEARLSGLEEQGKGDSAQAEQIRENLRQAREQMRTARQQAGAPGQFRPKSQEQPAPGRRADIQNRIRTLDKELQNQEDPQSDRAGQLRKEIRQLRAQMQQMDNRPPAEGQPPVKKPPVDGAPRPQVQLQDQVQKLQGQMSNLNRQMEQLQRTLDQLVQQRSAGQSS